MVVLYLVLSRAGARSRFRQGSEKRRQENGPQKRRPHITLAGLPKIMWTGSDNGSRHPRRSSGFGQTSQRRSQSPPPRRRPPPPPPPPRLSTHRPPHRPPDVPRPSPPARPSGHSWYDRDGARRPPEPPPRPAWHSRHGRPPPPSEREPGGLTAQVEAEGRPAPQKFNSNDNARVNGGGEGSSSSLGGRNARGGIVRAAPVAGSSGGAGNDSNTHKSRGPPAKTQPAKRRVTFASHIATTTEFARQRRPSPPIPPHPERPRERVGHGYTQVGGPIGPNVKLDASAIDSMLAESTCLRSTRDYGRADAIDQQLFRAGVRINTMRKEWRADGGTWEGVRL